MTSNVTLESSSTTSTSEENWDADDSSSPYVFTPGEGFAWDKDVNEPTLSTTCGDTVGVITPGSVASYLNADFKDSVDDVRTRQKEETKLQFTFVDRKVFVRNVNFKTSQRLLWNFFKKFGAVQHCHLLLDRRGRPSGNAVVIFVDISASEAALLSSSDERFFDKRILEVSQYRQKIFESTKKETETETDNLTTDSAGPSENELPSEIQDSPIFQLNNDMMIKIFTYLSISERLQAERVCKNWRRLSIENWRYIKHLKFETSWKNSNFLTDRFVALLFKRGCSSLESLDLSSSSVTLLNRSESLRAIASHCPNLKEINISKTQITNIGLKLLANGCHNLESFFLKSSKVGEDGIWWIFHRCKKLKRVDLSGCAGLKGQCLHVIGSDVLYLDLSYCTKLRDVGMKKIEENCHKLQELKISGCYSLTDDGFKSVGKLTSITSLDVSGCFRNEVTSSGLMEIRLLKSLENLILTENLLVDDLVIVSISQNCQKLKSLYVQACRMGIYLLTDVAMESVADNCPLLSRLDISRQTSITDRSFEFLSRLENLEYLVSNGLSQITDHGVKSLLNCCPCLKSVELDSCFNVTKESVYAAIARMEKDQTGKLYFEVDQCVLNPVEVITCNLSNLEIYFHRHDFDDDEPGSYFSDDDDNYYDDDYYDDDQDLSQFHLDDDGMLENDDPLEDERWNPT